MREEKPIRTTLQLAAAIGYQGRSRSSARRQSGSKQIHPATRVFQVCRACAVFFESNHAMPCMPQETPDVAVKELANLLTRHVCGFAVGAAHCCE